MPALSPRDLRKFIFDRFIASGAAPVVEEILHHFQVPREEVTTVLGALQDSHHLMLLPGTQRILMANPFSNLPTPFRVSAGAKEYYANCAWDAVAFHPMLEKPIQIASYCHHCGDPITLRLADGRGLPPASDEVLVHLGTPVSRWYDNLISTCSNTMVFFRSRSHLTEWSNIHPEFSGETLSVSTTIEVVRPISQGRAEIDYAMPSRERLMAHWASIGLDSSFWKF